MIGELINSLTRHFTEAVTPALRGLSNTFDMAAASPFAQPALIPIRARTLDRN